jgi:hypothetical protein
MYADKERRQIIMRYFTDSRTETTLLGEIQTIHPDPVPHRSRPVTPTLSLSLSLSLSLFSCPVAARDFPAAAYRVINDTRMQRRLNPSDVHLSRQRSHPRARLRPDKTPPGRKTGKERERERKRAPLLMDAEGTRVLLHEFPSRIPRNCPSRLRERARR